MRRLATPTERTLPMSDTLTMYQATVPVSQRALRNLRALLVKGEAHAQAQGEDPSVLLQTRL